MSDNCSACGQTLPGEITAGEIEVAVNKSQVYYNDFWSYNLGGKTLNIRGRDYKLAEIARQSGSGNELDQGAHEDVWVVFRVGDLYYKKAGWTDSYGSESSWHVPVTQVTPVEKIVTVFE